MRRLVLAFVGGLLVITGAALATPGIGALSAPVCARHAAEELNVHNEAGIKLKTKDAVDVVTQSISIARAARPAGTVTQGRCSSPQSGALTIIYAGDACRVHVSPGETFLHRGDRIHTARNLARVKVDFWATHLPGPAGSPFRIDAPAQDNCGF